MRSLSVLIGLFLLFASCSEPKNKQVSLEGAPVTEAKVTSEVRLQVGDGVKTFGWHDGQLFVQRSIKSPLFLLLNMKGEPVDSFGVFGHGENELMMPTLLAGNGDKALHIYDNGTKNLFRVRDGQLSLDKRLSFPFAVNEMKSVGWPCVGYSYFNRDSVKLEIYNADTQKVCATFNIVDPKHKPDVFMLSVSWDAYAGHLVYAHMYYNKFCITEWDADKQQVSGTFECSLDQAAPKKEKCCYTAVACGERSFFLLSQKNVKSSAQGGGGYSEIEEFDYDGNALRRIRLDGLYMQMAYDHQDTLFLLSLDEDVVKCLDVRH